MRVCGLVPWVGLLGVPVGRVAWCACGRRPAREIATREPDGSEWSISKPGQAPPPPTAAAARPRLEAWPGPSGGDLKYQRIRPSSALPVLSPVREIIRPAGAKEAKNAAFGCAGRTFSRNRCRTGRWESFVPGLALGAVQSSPCSASWWCERYKVLPARAKRAEMGNFGRVGRVLYRRRCSGYS